MSNEREFLDYLLALASGRIATSATTPLLDRELHNVVPCIRLSSKSNAPIINPFWLLTPRNHVASLIHRFIFKRYIASLCASVRIM